MEAPGRDTVTGAFLCSAITSLAWIVIGVILPLGAALQQRVEATSCNRDIFTILKSGLLECRI